ncbi:MAG: ABC transporter ATP-binding protein [Hoeflea sp.]|uniref:ABC transporter ATP-binding protein n=1 Tax=Hoeflea sp. TaxID=1940281 RepID=UPI0027309763|nr:ABC transporter ATP-binding protein [Hoeflea sp.]MDP2121667.1 ABC transporter ATP-binding protein [Hoeflea sp.]
MLEISQLKVFHGVIEAVHGIDVSVSEGQCVSLLGPNGAGKTSTLSAITGTAKSTGSIRLLGEDMTRLSIEERCRKGIAISPEGRRIFSNLTVRDNMLMGGAMRRDRAALLSEIGEWFERFPILGERAGQMAGTLSGGEQQMLAIARALLSRPRILLLDEPSLGLAPQIVAKIFEIIRELKSRGITILLVEQNAAAAIGVSDKVYILNNGRISRQGAAAEFGDGSDLMDELTGVHS